MFSSKPRVFTSEPVVAKARSRCSTPSHTNPNFCQLYPQKGCKYYNEDFTTTFGVLAQLLLAGGFI
jgi:hypothetical protein